MILVNLDIPDFYVKKAEYVFGFFGAAWGLSVKCGRFERAEILYTTNPDEKAVGGVVVIPFQEGLYKPATRCNMLVEDGMLIWGSGTNSRETDLVGSTYRLLNLLDESQVDPSYRDHKGTFLRSALPLPRRMCADEPLADHNSELLWKKLLRMFPHLEHEAIPRWPFGAKYAVCLTHDTDVVNLGAPTELAKNFLKSLGTASSVYFRTFLTGLKYVGKPDENPAFGFPIWKQYEYAKNLRSCFYLYIRPLDCKFHVNDCKSSVITEKINWKPLRDMARDGWEFGYHPPINAKSDANYFNYAKLMLEKRLGTRIYGLRHHWWALDWMKPYKTFKKHIAAGYQYDSSIAWRGAPGFRAGTCLPYIPYDPENDHPLDIWELPTCLMDGHVMDENDGDLSSAVETSLKIIQRVKDVRGPAVMNWHTESACNRLIWKDRFTLLEALMQKMDSSEVWFATPKEITDHWNERWSRKEHE